jgi:hypothetical protein
MKILAFSDFALGCVAVASLAACGGSPSPVGAPGTPSQIERLSARAGGQHGALLYVSEPATNSVSFYAYPALTYKGELSRLRSAAGLCNDPRTGNVWVISFLDSGGYKLSEFAHGGTNPVRTLRTSDPELNACSVNPINGDVAVTQFSDYDDVGGLFVFSSGSSKPARYQGAKMFLYYFVGYDGSGNLFVDGTTIDGRFRLDELPSGGKKLIDVTPAGLKIGMPGGVQYDGTYITVGDQHKGLIYRISDEKVVGETKLLQTCLVRQFAIDADAVIAPNYCRHKGDVLVYHYPAGGSPTHEVSGLSSAFAATVSQ